MRKAERFLSKQGHLQRHFHSKVRQLRKKLWNGLFHMKISCQNNGVICWSHDIKGTKCGWYFILVLGDCLSALIKWWKTSTKISIPVDWKKRHCELWKQTRLSLARKAWGRIIKYLWLNACLRAGRLLFLVRINLMSYFLYLGLK